MERLYLYNNKKLIFKYKPSTHKYINNGVFAAIRTNYKEPLQGI